MWKSDKTAEGRRALTYLKVLRLIRLFVAKDLRYFAINWYSILGLKLSHSFLMNDLMRINGSLNQMTKGQGQKEREIIALEKHVE